MLPRRQLTRLAVPRAPRAARCNQVRFQSQSTSSSSSNSAGSSTTHLLTSVAGGIAGAALFYGAYSFTPAGRAASAANKTMSEVQKKYQEAAKTLQQNTPTADEAVKSMKEHAQWYARWVPGASQYVDMVFNDWETVRKNHKDEADEIVVDTYKKLRDVSRAGLGLDTASRAFDVLAEFSRRIASLSADAFSDVIDNHPELKKQFGGSIDQLKSMGDKYGPEAKKQVDETWKEVKKVLEGGFSAANLDKVRKLIEDKVQQVKKLGDDAWKKALDEAKPYLDKNPKAKELIEDNAEALKEGDYKELFDKAKSAVDSDKIEDLEKYVKSAAKQVSSKE